jgi:hypothetical protein
MKKLLLLTAALFVVTSPVYAQQPTQGTVVQQLMTNDANIKAALADQLDKANVQIAALKAENEALKKAQPKPEAKKPAKEK